MSLDKKISQDNSLTQYPLNSAVILFIVMLLCSRAECQARKVTTEEYIIYSTILNAANKSIILNRKREFPGIGKWGGLFVIQTRTSGMISDYYIKGTSDCEGKFPSRDLLDKLLMNNRLSYPLSNHFSLTTKYRLLSKRAFADFFKTSGPFVGYEDFHKKYGVRSAYYTLSRAGFNSKKTKALVYVFEASTPISAFARFIQLSKLRGKWRVVAEFGC